MKPNVQTMALAIRDACIHLSHAADELERREGTIGPVAEETKAIRVAVINLSKTIIEDPVASAEKLVGLEVKNQEAWAWYSKAFGHFAEKPEDLDAKTYKALLKMDRHALEIRGLSRLGAPEPPPPPPPAPPKADETKPAPARKSRPRR